MKKINSLKVMYIFLGLSLVSLTAIGFSNWVIINESSTTSTLAAKIGDISSVVDKPNFTRGSYHWVSVKEE